MIEIAVFIYLLIRKDKKVVKETREKLADDFPGRYEESERPYYEYFN
jgi:hypothetical protein